LPGGPVTVHRKTIITLAANHRLPAVYAYRYYSVEGGLASYGASIPDQWRRAANYVNRIFMGENAGELPVEVPTKFEFVLNVKTANALGLNIPPTLLARADEVIE
jgi:putative ABC transport system substrate-binding protein